MLMSLREHKDYPYEAKRLQTTVDYIDFVLGSTEQNKDAFKSNIRQAMEELDFLDSSQSYINILTNAKLMEMAEKSFRSLDRVRNKPYFCRIDFKPEGSDQADKIYIGKTSLFRHDNHQPIIVDWRSPIANMYYEERLGPASYESEAGTFQGELMLKRQYTIDNAELEDIRDIDVTARDELLQESLGTTNDHRLKDIVATIQAEQNRVIRADMYKPLIVQGVAGSGKTTIAMHRIAYFIYTYAEHFDPDSFMIIAPNRLFLNYISDVLPELGVENVQQTTFIDFVQSSIGSKYKITDTEKKLLAFISHDSAQTDQNELSLMKWESRFKGSLEFKMAIDRFLEQWESKFLPEGDFMLGDHMIYASADVRRLFHQDYKYLPMYKRVEQIKKVLSSHLKMRKKEILRQTEDIFDDKMESARYRHRDMEKRRSVIIRLMDEKEKALAELERSSKTVLKAFMDRFPKMTLFDVYKAMFEEEQGRSLLADIIADRERVEYLCAKSVARLSGKSFELEDTGALLYLQHRLFGVKGKQSVRNVVIDEAQDFSPFQVMALKTYLDTSLFTILGDLSQGIHAYRGVQDWREIMDGIFGSENCSYVTLERSYRTTVEIMDLANEVIKKANLPDAILAKPVVRHGQRPDYRIYEDETLLLPSLSEAIRKAKDEGLKSVAVIGKSMHDCNKIMKALKKDKLSSAVKLLSGKEEIRSTDINVVPSYIAKGLEFDAVFIVNLDEMYIADDLDLKLLYVAMTRPLHRLSLFAMEGRLPVLEQVNSEFLTRNGSGSVRVV
jgi:DNA helicase-2/ATP-dependent DNA helicase PcrA